MRKCALALGAVPTLQVLESLVAGPTAEVLNEDIKDVRADIHDVRVDVSVVKAGLQHVSEDIKETKVDLRDIRGDLAVMKLDLHNVGIALAEHKGEVRVYMGLAKWAGAVLVTTMLTSGAAGIWWASSLNAKLDERSKATDARLDERFKAIDARLDERFKATDARLDKLEAAINKFIEQGRPAQPITKAEDGALRK